jgi:hypothetical protein
MPATIAGFPFWQFSYDRSGSPVETASDMQFRQELRNAGITDLFVFSHGWNNDQQTASILYTGFFGEMQKLISLSNILAGKRIGTAGVFWPSIRWPDTLMSGSGGAASVGPRDDQLSVELKKVFPELRQEQAIERLSTLLSCQQASDEAINSFIASLKVLLASESLISEHHDLEKVAATAGLDDWRQILDQLASTEPDHALPSEGGAASVGDFFERAWRGAKAALRVVTYWQMKARAGVIGRVGLGPALSAVAQDMPGIRLHLLGHSFGARLVSYSLAGLNLPEGTTSPVKSLFLIQGAFSHFAFAAALPFDPGRSGDLKGMDRRVDGPLLTTYSQLDTAVGLAYPFASVLANQDASAESDLMYRWEGIGHDGAQAVNAIESKLSSPPCEYAFEKGKWLNLNANDVIKSGPPPAGAHSDIIHPQTAWAALKASGVC